MPLDDYRAANLANWNDRVPIHVRPDGYDVDGFVADPERLSDVVGFDRTYLPDVAGKTLLHLQCHIGTDTLSWARLGARVTGLDFSADALAVARQMAARTDVDADFVEAELYDAPSAVPGSFDIVYTGVGAINWLPDIAGWARVAAHFVAPGGTFYIRDGHPMLYTMDWERQDDELVVAHPYFEHEEPITDAFDETYAGSGKVANARQYEWNHGLSEIIQGLIDAGLRIERFDEHRFLDWQGLDHMEMRDGVWVLPDGQHELVPLMFSILATKT